MITVPSCTSSFAFGSWAITTPVPVLEIFNFLASAIFFALVNENPFRSGTTVLDFSPDFDVYSFTTPPDVNLVPTGKEYTPNVEPGLSARNNNNCNSNAAYSMSWGMQYDKTGNAVYGTSWDFQDETVRHKKR